MVIKAIETVYNGYRFRSRLEARWAVFFDVLGIEYQYEPEGFELAYGGLYLPDFWLPKQQCWIEIKGRNPTREELIKAADLSFASEKWVDVVFGNIGEETIYGFRLPFGGPYTQRFIFTLCPHCQQLMVCSHIARRSDSDHGDYIGHCYACSGGTYSSLGHRSRMLSSAYASARQARFEHGETPTHPAA